MENLKLKIISLFIIFSVLIGVNPGSGEKKPSELLVYRLTCERINNPLGLDTGKPKLGWQITGKGIVHQKSYHIQVASSIDLLKANKPDLWDIKEKSDISQGIAYVGKPLPSRQICYWRVQVTDNSGNQSPWSKIAQWEMGLLEPGDWQARWIGYPGKRLVNWRKPVLPAPYFRKEFILENKPQKARAYICGVGYYELYINGQKVEDHVLDPVVTQFDKQLSYVVYDIEKYLIAGDNVIGVVLGNGWYNIHTVAAWHFNKASWRAYPKLLLQVEAQTSDNKKSTLISDETWQVSQGPIRFDQLRHGETYDARKELKDWLKPGYNHKSLKMAQRVPEPGGALNAQYMDPCKVMEIIPVVEKWKLSNGDTIIDFGQNITGWARITVKGKAGTKLTIAYAERLNKDRDIDQENISKFIMEGDCQTDYYTLKGKGLEEWEPRFTYHGFRYIRIKGLSEKIKLDRIDGCMVYTSFKKIGTFSSSSKILNRLRDCTEWSYIGNFTGIPTDCPHREKNGWTGDAQLAAETGLFTYDAANAYRQWIDSFAAIQRPSGQLPGIVPSSGWGFNWFSGPAWDSAFLLIPWYVYLYTGDSSAIEKHYLSMKKYVDFCTSMATDHIVSFGLGDHQSVDRKRIAPIPLTSTGYYYIVTDILAHFADMTGRSADARFYKNQAKAIKESFNRHFYKGDGIYADGKQTTLACAIFQGLVEEKEKPAVVKQLVKVIEENDTLPDFGILGAKYIPRVLAENGHVDLAYELITQDKFPGWVYWLNQGATTLWEDWPGKTSRNHIMFGDILAWMYQYLAGIAPDPEKPGFKHIYFKPYLVSGLDSVNAHHDSPYGKIRAEWKREDDTISFQFEVPQNTTAELHLPVKPGDTITSPDKKAQKAIDDSTFLLQPGKHFFTIKQKK